MDYFAGLDVPLESVNVCIVSGNGIAVREEKIGSEPEQIFALFNRFGHPLKRIGLEAGPTSSWLFSELRAAGYPALCLECRHVLTRFNGVASKYLPNYLAWRRRLETGEIPFATTPC